ncbi:MAG: response regulator, partial [Actinobacteria bacterium]|nr:response regulator [Actinomycetota bacterium]
MKTEVPELDPETPARILVCDDDADIRAIIAHSLEALGHQVTQAGDGEQAMSRCQEGSFDLIVMDIMMPGMSGLEVVDWYRANFPSPYVPILMVTALDETEDKVEGLRRGADDYLPKPFQARELQARVAALLRTRTLTERLRVRTEELEQLNQALA